MSDRADDVPETGAEDRIAAPTVAVAVRQALATGLADLRDRLSAPSSLDAAALHALRVSLRRARTVLAVIDRAAPTPAVRQLRDSAAALAEVIGRGRDWDVFVIETLATHAPDPATDGHAALIATAEVLRGAAHADVDAYRRGRDAERFLALFADLVARHGWQDAAGALGAAPLDSLARPALDRLHAKTLKRGRRLARQDADARHRLRLAVKRLRYAVDLFSPVFDGDGQTGYRRRLVALQDALGHGNDREVARRLADAVASATDHPDAPAALAALRQKLEVHDIAEEDHLRALWRRFRHRQTFWHDDV